MALVTNNPPRTKRFIEDYRLQYINKDFPLLSFIYAVMAGGEAPLYCDYTEKFVNEYLYKHFPDPGKRPAYFNQFVELLAQYDKLTEDRKKQVTADDKDWTIFLDCLKQELLVQPRPEAFW